MRRSRAGNPARRLRTKPFQEGPPSMRPTLPVLALAAALSPLSAAAQDVDIPFTRYELANGLEVILAEDHSIPVAHVEVWYHVGSKDETEGLSGFAHLFEHLMFQGSEHFDDEYFGPLQALGARINGTTNSERTNYYETVPSNGVERALWMEADRMGFLLPALTQAKLDEQRDVVKNERRQNYEIRPYAKARKVLSEALWPESHPYHHLTIGSHEDLTAATLDDVKSFFRTWYVPNNATLTVVGDIDIAATKGWIEAYFGALPKGPQPSPVTEADAPLPTVQRIELTDAVQLAQIQLAWRSPAFFAEGDADLDVLSSLLTSGKSSRLYKRLVFDDRIAKDVSAYQASAGLGSAYHVVATVAPGATLEQVEAALLEELDLMAAEGPTTEEVERAKNGWKKRFFQVLEGVAGLAGSLQSYNHFTGDPGYVGKDLDRYLGVTAESVKQWAAATIKPEHQITVLITPGERELEGASE
jgi:zinc protease